MQYIFLVECGIWKLVPRGMDSTLHHTRLHSIVTSFTSGDNLSVVVWRLCPSIPTFEGIVVFSSIQSQVLISSLHQY